MILIVGASGHLGGIVAQRLLEQGKPVRVMARNPASVARLEQSGAEVVRGDLRNPASLRSACQGVEQVLASAHALNGKGDNNPHTVDDLGNRQLIDAAKAADVKHFIFVSIKGAGPQSPLALFRIKYAVEEYLRASGMHFTILRPTAYMDLWGQLIGLPILQQGKAMIFGGGDNLINFVAADDVANLICAALDDPRALDQAIEVCGPENLTMNQVAHIFENLAARPARKRHVPLLAMRAASILMRLVNPTMGRLMRNGVFMDTADLRCDPLEAPQEFPLPLTRFEDWARRQYRSNSYPSSHVFGYD
ncbi:MAG: SDR family oxidoreductase [Anaerolineales bacterium]|jgi:uncharacterized protein YbjT (DUF2867 family)